MSKRAGSKGCCERPDHGDEGACQMKRKGRKALSDLTVQTIEKAGEEQGSKRLG